MALIRTLLLLLCLLALCAAPAHAQDAQDAQADTAAPALETVDEAEFQQAFRRMKRSEDAQWELKTDLPEPPSPPPGWVQALGRWITGAISALTPLFIAIFWIGVGALAMLLLYAVYTALRDVWVAREAQEEDAGLVAEYQPTTAAARILLEEADRLAAEGRYAEAIHLILYRSVQDIEHAQPDAVRLSLTSREIADSPRLGPRTQTVFAQIARLVERTHFAQKPATQPDYESARAQYEDLLTAHASPVSPAAAVPA